MMTSIRIHCYIGVFIGLLLFSCSSDNNPDVSQPADYSGTGQIEFGPNWVVSSKRFFEVEVNIYDQQNNPLRQQPQLFRWDEMKIDEVPAGPNRKVVVYGKLAGGIIIFRGFRDGINVVTGKTTLIASMNTQPYSPELVSPVSGTIFNSENFTLKWKPVIGATRYHVIVDTLVDAYTNELSYTNETTMPEIESNADGGNSKTYLFPDTGQIRVFTATIPDEDGDYNRLEKQPSYSLMDIYGQPCQGKRPYFWRISAIDEFGKEGSAEVESFETVCAMVRDNVTGLVWEVKTDDDSLHDMDNTYTWQEAQEYVDHLNAVNFGGGSQQIQWRVPTIKDLATIVTSARQFPAINSLYFPNMMQYPYWSSTENIFSGKQDAWVVDFATGEVNHYPKEVDMSEPIVYTIAVKGAPQIGDPFIENADGKTVTDQYGELMWMKPLENSERYTWEAALNFCENLVLYSDGSWATKDNDGNPIIYIEGEWKQLVTEYELPDGVTVLWDDWRLPNRNELMSLVDYSRNSPAVDTYYFPYINSDNYWTSTTVIEDTSSPSKTNAWVVNLQDGRIGNSNKINPDSRCFVLPMRDFIRP